MKFIDTQVLEIDLNLRVNGDELNDMIDLLNFLLNEKNFSQKNYDEFDINQLSLNKKKGYKELTDFKEYLISASRNARCFKKKPR